MSNEEKKRTRSSARYILAVKMSAPAPCFDASAIRSRRNKQSSAYHGFTQEILLQGPLSHRVVLKRDVAVGTESTRKHRDVPKHRFPAVTYEKNEQTREGVHTKVYQGC
jgi:hypothetical protein